MGFSLNQVNLIGKLGRDAETRFTTNNNVVTNFSIATDHNYKDKNGEWQTVTEWHNIVAWGLSDWHREALKKGVSVHIGGRLSHRKYEDKDGNDRYITEVIADKSSVIIFDTRNGGSHPSEEDTQPQEYKSSNDSNDDLPF